VAQSGDRAGEGGPFLQEEAPDEVGAATARFVSKVLAGQIS
jgi:haloalkane dehalogenase